MIQPAKLRYHVKKLNMKRICPSLKCSRKRHHLANCSVNNIALPWNLNHDAIVHVSMHVCAYFYPHVMSLLKVSFIMYIIEIYISYCIYNVNENMWGESVDKFVLLCGVDDMHVEILVIAWRW